MMRNSLPYLLAGAILAAVAFAAFYSAKDTVLLEQCAASLEVYLEEQEQAALQWIGQERSSLQAVLQGRLPREVERWRAALRQQTEQPYTLVLSRGDSILFTSNNAVAPPGEYVGQLSASGEQRRLMRLPSGIFYTYARPWDAQTTLSVWVPVELRSMDRRFWPAVRFMPSDVEVVSASEGTPVRIASEALFGLRAKGRVQAFWAQAVVLMAGLLFLVVLLAWVSRLALRLYAQGRPLLAASVLVLAWVGVVTLNSAAALGSEILSELEVFARPLEQPLLGARSVGDLLLHLALLLWLAGFFHRVSRVEGLTHRLTLPVRIGLSALAYAATIGSTLGLIGLCHWLIFRSGISFDFDNLLNVDRYSTLALAGLLLVLLATFLFHHRFLFTAYQCGLTRGQQGVALGVATLIALALAWVGGLPAPWPVPAMAALAAGYVALFQYSIAQRLQRLVGLALWLMLFLAIVAWALYSFHAQKDRQVRLAYAEALAIGRDSTHAEPLLRQVAPVLASDSAISYLLKPWPFRPLTTDLRQRAYEQLYPYGYLFQNYRLSVFAFDKDGSVLPQDQPQDRAEVVGKNWDQGTPLTGLPQVRYLVADNGVFRYMVRTSVRRMNDPAQPAEVFYFFDHIYPQPTRVYSELFYRLPFRGMERLFAYDYAVQRRGYLVVDQGEASRAVFAKDLPRGQAEERLTAQPRRADAVYSTTDGSAAAAVGRPLGDARKPLYLFSVLFALCLLFIVVIALLNTWLDFLPAHYQLSFAGRGSLSKRIHYRTFALIGAGFAGAIILTYMHFADQARQREQADLDRRAEALLTYLRIQLSDVPPQADTLSRLVPQLLTPQAASLATDVNFFDSTGNIVFSTQNPLVRIGVLPNRMSTEALVSLMAGLEQETTVAERAGGATYTNRYLPVRNNQNQLLGFLGVPYYLTERKVGPEVSDFIGLLASVYVFLMLIAYGVSYTLSNSIISPLKLMANKIQRLKLEDKNEPLEYAQQAGDEISALIEEYNRMVEKLENSKAQLIRLERESAWREMARQVAHDIKNPLTTIKLSMQQLDRLSGDPAQAAAYLKKAIARLIEQIDSLAQIATEFSLFANLDIRQKQDMVLNDVVENVYDLFTEDRNVELSIDLPDERFLIRGDKSHLIRVFNNLVINAIQAIPPERKGHIHLSLTRQGDYSVVRIRDNGGGIPPEIQKRVFEPNFTTKSSGSGLGLAICKRIIEAHDGNIYFETRPGEGTDFYVELPIAPTGVPAEPPEKALSN